MANKSKNKKQAPPQQVNAAKPFLTPKEKADKYQKDQAARVEKNLRLVASPTYSAVSTQTGEAIDLSYLVTSFDIGMRRLRDTFGRNPRMTMTEAAVLVEKGQSLILMLNDFNKDLYRKVGISYSMPIRLRKQTTQQEPAATTPAKQKKEAVISAPALVKAVPSVQAVPVSAVSSAPTIAPPRPVDTAAISAVPPAIQHDLAPRSVGAGA